MCSIVSIELLPLPDTLFCQRIVFRITKTVLLKIDGDVKIRVDKSSIVRDTTDVQK